MTSDDRLALEQAAARAALSVPGVAELPPGLGRSLAAAATRVRRALGSPAAPPRAGVRAERAPHAGGWTVDVRCALHDDRRTLDVARDVHDHVHAAAVRQLARQGAPGPVTVTVSVTRLVRP